MSEPVPSGAYVMGGEERERRRLALQGLLLNPITTELLQRARIGPGMRVLDIGCGIGDVSLIASQLVGQEGHVIGIDIDPAALETARTRAQGTGYSNSSFVNSSIEEFKPEQTFDAVIGRHILLHTRKPFEVVCAIKEHLTSGGVACLQEFDFSVVHPSYPPCPRRDELLRLFRDFFSKVAHGNIGTQLYHLFVKAGFVEPECRAEYLISGGEDLKFYEWATESMRSIYPTLKSIGLAPAIDLNFDTLAEQLRAEAIEGGSSCPAPVMVGGFARKA